jgi:amino acid adenylation domain-containing protein
VTPRTVPDLVAEQARLTPDAIAVEDATERLTYAELLARADALARRLVARGVRPGEIVALHAERTAAGLAALLGIWRAGAAYLPLDPEAPPARLATLMRDAACRALVGGAAAEALAQGGIDFVAREACADEEAAEGALPTPDPQGLAYVLYTSGSTGAPKGVLVTHEGLHHRALVQREWFPMRVGERVSQFTSLAWDASLFEILLAWGSGATLCLIPPPARRSGDALARFLGEARIDVAFFPPSVLATIPPTPLPRLRMMMVGGEACPRALVERWGGMRRFVNHYGPTETTVWMSTDECRPDETPTLGRAIPGVDVLVLDPSTRALLPEGATGELAVGGIGLAAGYLGRPDATHARFVPHPADADRLVYLTGDLARLLPDGRPPGEGARRPHRAGGGRGRAPRRA